jgi:hypothetical protein
VGRQPLLGTGRQELDGSGITLMKIQTAASTQHLDWLAIPCKPARPWQWQAMC